MLVGIVIEVSEEHSEKAPPSREVTLLGMVIEVSEEHSEKADSPMLVTLLGIIVFLHPAINVFVAVFIIALQLSRLS